jgi:hypothetical protein
MDSGSEPVGGITLHLVGLNLSKAWCLAGIAATLDDHRHVDAFEESAGRYAERGLERAFTDEYAGAHWLSSFVLHLLTRNEGSHRAGVTLPVLADRPPTTVGYLRLAPCDPV